MDRRLLIKTGLATIGAGMVPSALRAQGPLPGAPTPGLQQATIADPAPAPDVTGRISPQAHGKSLMVVNKQALTIGFYDAATGQTQKTFSLPPRPHELLIARNGRTAYVSIYGDGIYSANPHPGNQVAIVDLAERRCTGFLSTGSVWAPHGLAEAPDGTIWASCDIGKTVVGFDPASQRQVGAIPVNHAGGHWIVAHPTNGTAFLSNRAGSGIVVVDLAQRRVAGTIDTPHAITGLALSPDGARLFAADDQRPALLTIDTAARTILASTDLEGLPFSTAAHGDRERRVRVSPDGRYVLVADFPSAGLVRVDAARPQRQKLLLIQHGPMGMAFSPDGATLWACNHDAGTITIVDVATMTALRDFAVEPGAETAALLG
ncbi:YncE family protein [Sphingomonas sp. BK580]|uniref:YncE family protein n=1 Tax=Sphingomonas sp. BK580 TaxID=2586972 RepID=UPI001611D578|nr:hypothetical protein [Sphingomonas sp. BK580]MBB3695220.1 DNA-binding beta-propeller fold protein YncE [Sphingomonas sp. BK580]